MARRERDREREMFLEERAQFCAQEEQLLLWEQNHMSFNKRVVNGEAPSTLLMGEKNENIILQFIWKAVLGHTGVTASQSNWRGSWKLASALCWALAERVALMARGSSPPLLSAPTPDFVEQKCDPVPACWVYCVN